MNKPFSKILKVFFKKMNHARPSFSSYLLVVVGYFFVTRYCEALATLKVLQGLIQYTFFKHINWKCLFCSTVLQSLFSSCIAVMRKV